VADAQAAGEAPRLKWRTIDALAELVGRYCWLENRIFEISGDWASAPVTESGPDEELPPPLRVWCAGVSRRHGLLAGRWAERLPVRAGVDAAALVAPPPGPLQGALMALEAGADHHARVAVLAQAVLPCLQAVYAAHERTATPVNEGPVLEVLVAARRTAAAEIGGGRMLLETSARGLTRDAELGPEIERAFAETGVLPAVRTS
jgi:hypothetical protein